MVWSLAIVDQGISNWFERTHRRNVYEYDAYGWDNETDYGVDKTHGTYAALAARSVQPGLGFIDLKIMDSAGQIDGGPAERGLAKLLTLSKQGYGIGAVNLSWGGVSYPWQIVGELSELRSRGILTVAASGNSGSAASFDVPFYPASLPDVIAVGSHDGAGNPSPWAQNHPGYVTVLADGQDMPEPGVNGTSFAAPQVAAGVASLQAYARYGIGRTLTLAEMRDALQQGGRAPLSNADPADGKTRYHLYDYNGVVDYFRGRYLQASFDPLSYLASYPDLMAAYGANAQAGLSHFLGSGAFEGRSATFDGWSYLAANPDLLAAFGANLGAGLSHYISIGRQEQRGVAFDATGYLAANMDLVRAFGTDPVAAARHYAQNGVNEGRSTRFDAYRYVASHADLIVAFGTNVAGAARHYISNGYAEGRGLSFDGAAYLAMNPDLVRAFGGDMARAAQHYVEFGYREGRATGPEPLPVSEGLADLPGSVATTGRIAVGSQVTGTITPFGGSIYSESDSDWYAIRLRAGQSVSLSVTARPTGSHTLSGLTLALYDNRGVALQRSGSPYSSPTTLSLAYTASSANIFYVGVEGYAVRASWTLPALPQPYTITATDRRVSGPLAPAADAGLLGVGV